MRPIYSTVIPLVGTLNDDGIASPCFYHDVKGLRAEVLEETPAIKRRKERCRYHLRQLEARFLDHEPLFLYVRVSTCNEHIVDATNVLDLIQNSGIKVVWCDDSQFVGVHCERTVNPRLRRDQEFMVVYVWEATRHSMDRPSGIGNLRKARKDCSERFDVEKSLSQYFSQVERVRLGLTGFWEDPRFLKILALKPAYISWLVKNKSDRPIADLPVASDTTDSHDPETEAGPGEEVTS